MDAGRFLYKYLAKHVINFRAFEGRTGVCFGILPSYEGVAKAIEMVKNPNYCFMIK
jgi:hypothetical protein